MSFSLHFRGITGFTVNDSLDLMTDCVGVGPGLGALVASGLYTFLKVFGYEKIGGAGDRDDTMMVARLIEQMSHEGNGEGKVVVAEVVSKSTNGGTGAAVMV